jgi:hypothetical protein
LVVTKLHEALETLGAVLESRQLSSRILVAGGSSLLLLGLIDRPTADLDVIGLASSDRYVKAETIPAPLAEAARDVGLALGLPENWLTMDRLLSSISACRLGSRAESPSTGTAPRGSRDRAV